MESGTSSNKPIRILRNKQFIETPNGEKLFLFYRRCFTEKREVVFTLSLEVRQLDAARKAWEDLPEERLIHEVCGRLFVVEAWQDLLEVLSLKHGKQAVVDELVFWEIRSEEKLEAALKSIGKVFGRRRALHVMVEDGLDRRVYRMLRNYGFSRLKGSGLLMAGGVGRFARRRLEVSFF